MPNYNQAHAFYAGVDLHARSMFVHIVNARGKTVFENDLPANPNTFLDAIEPFRKDVVVGCECMFAWYWLANLCEAKRIPFVLGHALAMKHIHGGKTKSDRIDAGKLAAMLRGGMFPMAYVYPKAKRQTRDLLRRRNFFVRQRSQLITHIVNTNSQFNHPPLSKKLTYAANRSEELLTRFDDPSTKLMIATDLKLIDAYDEQIAEVERHLLGLAPGPVTGEATNMPAGTDRRGSNIDWINVQKTVAARRPSRRLTDADAELRGNTNDGRRSRFLRGSPLELGYPPPEKWWRDRAHCFE